MNVLQYISELLYSHDCVIVPGFGGFVANPVSASIHPVSHSFSPPSKEIMFNPALTTNDGILANHIAAKENISYAHALHEIHNFVAEIRATLDKGENIGISRVGTIYLDKESKYIFDPEKETNFLLSSFGLSNFTSPAIQREGIEKRIEKVFAESKVFRSERKKQNVFAKVAIISIPAAAVFVWGFLNVGVIQDVSTNYSNLLSIFAGKSEPKAEVRMPFSFNPRSVSPFTDEDAFDVSAKYNIFQHRIPNSVIYPCLVSSDTLTETVVPIENETKAEAVTPTGCSFYIIGSCNKSRENAENYKQSLISKGYSNANIIEPSGNGLYKVFINCFDNEASANEAMNNIHAEVNPNAWLLKM
ncbi:MAG: SPOR domain-containing protein [Bacteroidota bacterium]